jgi:phosphoribosylaminoimidazolecarboxamide formyltransferase/IMP cyclohydrolase
VTEVLPVRRALVAVADKTGVVELVARLVARGVEVVSTGRTAATLREAGLPVREVAELTGFPELLGGRVKTLHPAVHAAILADKRRPEHLEELRARAIEPFDLVVVNLYPFRETVAAGAPEAEVVERIDVGGPAMVRAAAKNFESVAVVVSPDLYGEVLAEVEALGGVSRPTRQRLAALAFDHTARYDLAIAHWFAARSASPDGLPPRLLLELVREEALRYGENPHQRGALYRLEHPAAGAPLGGARVLQGKEMSFNNWLDAEAARAVAGLFDPARPAAAIVKHHNPCGVALGRTPAEAYERALACDPVSAFGGIVAFNVEVDEEAARAMEQVFTEVVVAPSYSAGALGAFAARPNLRVLQAPPPEAGGLEVRPIDGGALVQDPDRVVEGRSEMKVVTSASPSPEQWEDLLFAWRVAARVKSNAIVLASGSATVGIGAGQMNRVTAVDLACRQAGERAVGSCLASDAFFPFRDGVDRAARAGVRAVIQPGGSRRDEEVIAAAEEHGMSMVFTGRRHFRH